MKVQTKLIVSMFVSLGLLVISFAIVQGNEHRRLAINVLQNTSEKSKKFADKTIKLNSKSLTNFTYDYSYWDEMVKFVQTKDSLWARENLQVVMPTYNLNAIWVYDQSGKLIYHTTNLSDRHNQIQHIIPDLQRFKQFLELLHKKRSQHFFIYTTNRLFEISAVTIHPTSDPERKTPPQGYLIASRQWSKAYISTLEDLISSQIIIQTFNSNSTPTRLDLDNNRVTFSETFWDWQQQPIAQALFTVNSPSLHEFEALHDGELWITIIACSIILLFLSITLLVWVSFPLRTLVVSLETENPDLVKSLKNQRSEFGELASLITQFFQQKSRLLAEITERHQVEAELRTAQVQLQELNQQLETRVQERTQALVNSEAELRFSLAEKVVLLQEIHHRVKNNLQVISSMLRLQSRRTEIPQLKTILEESQNRVMAMSLVHENLYRTPDCAQVRLREYVADLVRHLFGVFSAQLDQIDLQINISPEITLPLEQAIPCGLILNELITNAIKHGFHGRNQVEQLTIELQWENNGQFCLSVMNTGNPLPSDLDSNSSATLGLNLVKLMVEQMQAVLEVEREQHTIFYIRGINSLL
uniref:histidine kinase n=1 Tax=Cyanothece sp. (strain PCC 7425 / ATCC 29141) TaxID=395961 RepID=B8HR06_CYAP4